MPQLLTYSIWILFASICGILEAKYYSKVYRHQFNRIKFDHAIFTAFRILVASILLYFTFGLVWQSLIGGALLMMGFVFWHDGFYYQSRWWLDRVYPNGFLDHTTTSDAKFNFDFTQRLLMFLFSLLFLVL